MAPMEIGGAQSKAGLFAQLSFAIICRDAIDEIEAAEILETVRLHEGEAAIRKPVDDLLSLEGVSHVVASTFDFPEYDSACDALIPVIKPSWIEASLAKDKLANPRQYSPDPRLFMSDVVVCCADLPEGDADAIIGGVLAMGGLFTTKITSQVTHLVALTLESEPCVLVQNRRLPIKIVLPHWFDDCLKLGKRIDERPYMLPHPEILRLSYETAPGAIEAKGISGASDPDPSTSHHLQSPSRSNLDVFKKKNVMLSADLGIGSHLRCIFEKVITEGGGKMISSVRRADMYVCKYREGENYITASQLGKDVGNLGWLYYLITTNTWTSPIRRPLHYPISRSGIPGLSGYRISVSNYSGEARVYLENLIKASGAECTKTLKQDNTHLITAHTQSEKCNAAKDWNIHVVNHLWLEESYARWKVQSVTDPRYTHFPKRTNLGEVVGQVKLDRGALQRNFFPEKSNSASNGNQLPQAMQDVDQNVVLGHEETGQLGRSSSRSKGMKLVGRAMREEYIPNSDLRHRTPATPRTAALGKENETPGTGSSRKSKEAAAARLHEMTPDMMLYEKERKRVGGVIYGGRRKNDPDRVSSRKRSFDAASETDEVDAVDPKRTRRSGEFTPICLLISGFKAWVGHPKQEDHDKKQLARLGIHITFDPSRATHLAAPNILRTAKFVTAITYAPTIISTQYIEDCLQEDACLDPEEYLLQDQANEKKFGISLQLAIERAKENRQQLLAGRTVFCTENIKGGFETFKAIVEVNGGTCFQYTGRKGVMVPSRRAESEPLDDPSNEVMLISNQDGSDDKLWSRFKQMAEGSRKTPRIVKADWLLETAMCQKIQGTAAHELA